jgi:hypothetical protein
MTWFLTAILVLSCVSLFVWGMLEKSRMLQFPFLAASAIAVQFIPSIFALSVPDISPLLPSQGALNRFIVMTILCLGVTALGYFWSDRPPRRLTWDFDMPRLLQGGVVLVIVGWSCGTVLNSLPSEMLSQSQWSGLPVRYLFFASMGSYGFVLALLIFTKTWNRWALIAMLPGVFGALWLMMHGRRTPTAMFFLSLLCALWFNRRIAPPKWLMLIGMAAFSVFVFNIGEIRMIANSNNIDKVNQLREIDVAGTFKKDKVQSSASDELINSCYIMEAAARSGQYDMGLTVYNTFIAAYVPRQMVGEEFKNSLMARGNSDVTYEVFGYTSPVGSCPTGIADAFASFSYAGSLMFFMLGYIMRRLWEGSMHGHVIHQLLYVSVVVLELGTYGGAIANLTTPWIHIILFAGPILLWARERVPYI